MYEDGFDDFLDNLLGNWYAEAFEEGYKQGMGSRGMMARLNPYHKISQKERYRAWNEGYLSAMENLYTKFNKSK